MATIELVKEAILALKDRTGSSVQAINKWIEAEKKVGSFRHFIRRQSLEGEQENTRFLQKNQHAR